MTGSIPQSDALAEASPQSLAELMSRDPEGYQQRDLDAIIDHLRKHRVACEAAEANKPRRASGRATLSTQLAQSADDLGL